MFWFSLQLLSETFLILSRTEGDRSNMYIGQVPVLLVRFLTKLDFLNRFSKNTQIPNFMKIRPAGAELSHADGWTDRQTC